MTSIHHVSGCGATLTNPARPSLSLLSLLASEKCGEILPNAILCRTEAESVVKTPNRLARFPRSLLPSDPSTDRRSSNARVRHQESRLMPSWARLRDEWGPRRSARSTFIVLCGSTIACPGGRSLTVLSLKMRRLFRCQLVGSCRWQEYSIHTEHPYRHAKHMLCTDIQPPTMINLSHLLTFFASLSRYRHGGTRADR